MKKHRAPPVQLPTHRRWNIADAQRVLAAIERSGETVEDFANAHRLRAGRIELWRRRLGHQLPATAPGFQEISPATVSAALAASPKSTVDLVFPDGRVLRFDPGLCVDRLGAIARALAEAERC